MVETFKIRKSDINTNIYIHSRKNDLYNYLVITGKQENYNLDVGSSLWTVKDDKAYIIRGPKSVSIDGFAVIIKGYNSPEKTSTFEDITNLPYVNGCSSNQIFPPIRVGDPTMQLLYIPPNTTEQVHHIHSTTRVVYVYSGTGVSVQGMKGDIEIPLKKGDVLVFDKMTPHHFKTFDDELIVIPIHIFSSTILEKNHPMFNGTFEI